MIWGIVGTVVAFFTALMFSLGKISSRGERITSGHRDELLSRKEKFSDGNDTSLEK